ncbi:hypothetical protein ACCZ74_12420 [Agrobacterium vitis]|uniref:hypothetical protein n=1 Tax=Agrobacterium vitis TaxID=373 RepID=UPI00403EB27A
MSEIPEDVMMNAERLYDEGGQKSVPQIIAEAIMAERIRCYEIAMDLGNYDELSIAKAIKRE